MTNAWTDAAENERQTLIQRFVELAHTENWREALTAFELSESEFIELPVSRRDELREDYLQRSGLLRRLTNATLAEAQAMREAGDASAVQRRLEAVRRLAQANDSPDVVALGRIVAQGIARSEREFDARE